MEQSDARRRISHLEFRVRHLSKELHEKNEQLRKLSLERDAWMLLATEYQRKYGKLSPKGEGDSE